MVRVNFVITHLSDASFFFTKLQYHSVSKYEIRMPRASITFASKNDRKSFALRRFYATSINLFANDVYIVYKEKPINKLLNFA